MKHDAKLIHFIPSVNGSGVDCAIRCGKDVPTTADQVSFDPGPVTCQDCLATIDVADWIAAAIRSRFGMYEGHDPCGPMPSADAIAEVVRDARRAVLDAAGRTTDAERKALGARIVRIESAVFNSIIDSD